MPAPYFDPDAPDDGGDELPAAGGAPVFNPDADTDGTPANGNAAVQPKTPAPSPDSDDHWLEDLALSFADGALLGKAGELGDLGQKIGHGVADIRYSQLFSKDLPPTRGPDDLTDDSMSTLYEQAGKSRAGQIGKTVGSAGTHALAAAAMPAAIPAQMATGAMLGYGATDSDASLLDELAGTGEGAAGGAVAGALSKAGGAVKDLLGGPIDATARANPTMIRGVGDTVADAIAKRFPMKLPSVSEPFNLPVSTLVRGASALGQQGDKVGAAIGAGAYDAQHAKAGAQDLPLDVQVGDAQMLPPYRAEIGEAQPRGPYRADIGEAQLLDELASPEGTAFARLQDEARQMRAPDQYGAQIPSYGGTIGQTPFSETELRKSGGFYPTSETPGEDVTVTALRRPGDAGVDIGEAQVKAYAGVPALTYAVHRVLSSDDSGLPDDARDQLTRAALRGDSAEVRALNFKLSQRYPGYARQMQNEIDALNMEE